MFTKIKLVAPVYRVGWTKPGMLPEVENISFSDLSCAKTFLAQKLNSIVVNDATSSRSLTTFLEKDPQQCNVQLGDYVYWITKE